MVEVDGEGHFTDDGKSMDRRRDEYLRKKGFRVLRIPGFEALRDPLIVQRNLEAFVDERMEELKEK